jgi:hypothetical protein
MSDNQSNNVPAQPVYIMQPQAQQPQTSNIFGGGLGGIILSTVIGVLLGQFGGGFGFPRFPKL